MLWLRLLRSRRVGVTTFWRLMAEHGDAAAALAALPGVARAAGVENYQICPEGVVQAELAAARRHGARMICRGEPEYPADLSDIADPPPILWAAGDAGVMARPMIALVGARNASSLGTRMARALAQGLGEAGFVVVSGLARGVDTAAHAAALDTGTAAVLGGGVDVLYPSENAGLAEGIRARGGALLSEQPMGTQPQARHFPARNRIVSGLSRAVVVVEAAAKSGSLITARCALDQGREVLAVPGHPLDARAGGCNILIRDGARLVRSAEDVVEALGPSEAPAPQRDLPLEAPAEDPRVPPAAPEKRSLAETAALHAQILSRLGPAPLAEDQLIRDLGATSGTVSPALTDLEVEGRIERRPGGLLSLVV
ncbi:Rossmann fold protein nucleotide-binding protein Smf possibly involved in DNA uptake [Salipiger mucosus DSM 16094]|uniref:Rossmann fold protein nucleotide-binding protein Smf possibly involved in DNA uptake n=1 Tax=Salipiger mucosus DSM 16094 TaxID=1123237 RepID=S9QFY1_9RHOB|nr:Rossmann fold protein nucleotide-binding protein Smf possibly involved in DNA uptake [Salipiger mucosus DSM 16094]